MSLQSGVMADLDPHGALVNLPLLGQVYHGRWGHCCQCSGAEKHGGVHAPGQMEAGGTECAGVVHKEQEGPGEAWPGRRHHGD